MPRIDPLLSAMLSNRADAVRLSDGDIAQIVKGGAYHPLTRQPLGEGQLLLLLREMAPPEVGAALGGMEPVEFTYSNADGRFVTLVTRANGTLQATVRAGAGEEETPLVAASVAPAAPIPASAAPVAAPAAPVPATGASMPAPAAAPMPAPAVAGTPQVTREAVNPAARAEMDALLLMLVEKSGSDLHLGAGEPPILRIHGELKRMTDMDVLTPERIAAMVDSIMPERNREEFEHTNDTDFAHEIPGVARFRGNTFRAHRGMGGVFRVIPDKVATVEDLGITPEVQALCFLTKGLVLVTGPTGSGKSTTLGAMVDLVNRSRDDHLITIEDPIEFVHKSKRCVITQRQVGLHTGSFKTALRAALREDPDIVLVGELRDLETISIALETAETGHLVFGTLHTTTATGTIDRIIDQFPADRQQQIRVMLADTLKGVVSQTLCKRVGGGRIAAREILLSVPALSNLIREGKSFQIPSIIQTSRKHGMIQLGDVLIDFVDQQLVTPHEAYLKATDKTAFVTMLKARGHDTGFLQATA